jgi:phosphoglycolate phosphatase
VTDTGRLGNDHYTTVLFDLDGTLVDTAPDMVRALHAIQRAHDREPVDYELGRSNVSHGAMGLLRIGFPDLDVDERKALVPAFIETYKQALCIETQVFVGLEGLLGELEAGSRSWGVVTNKPGHLTNPLLEALGLLERSAATVSGDTLPLRKPDPAPLLHAAEIAGVDPSACLYVGDALRDIEAGRRAGMGTIAAGYGYIPADENPARWDADVIARDTLELAQIVRKAVTLGT